MLQDRWEVLYMEKEVYVLYNLHYFMMRKIGYFAKFTSERSNCKKM